MQEVLFSENLVLFEKKNPRGAALLSLADPSRYELVQNEKAGNLFDRATNSYVHDKQDPRKEAAIWIEQANIIDVELLCVYGVGLGCIYKALEPWLFQRESRFVVFLEDDLGMLWHFLHTEEAHRLLTSGKGQLFYLEESKEGVALLQTIAWATIRKKYAFHAFPFYQKEKRAVFQEIEKRFYFEQSEIDAVSDEYLVWGIPYFRNFWQNSHLFAEVYNGQKLFSQFRKIPAIIAAAGPSLDEEKELLRTLQDRALLFAGGSAINALCSHGIRPDFLVGIDPNPTQYLRFRESFAYDIPCFFRSRFHPEALKMVSGKKLYLRGGDGYQLSNWIENRIGVHGPIIGGGHNVANFALEIAYMLGCDPIILVGFDLAYSSDMKLYAKGVTSLSSEGGAPLLWKNENGEDVYTEYKRIAESAWITAFHALHPRRRLLNATRGGLGIANVPRMTLQEIQERFLQKSYDLHGYTQAILGEVPLCAESQEFISTKVRELQKSIVRTKKSIEALLQLVQGTTNIVALQESFDYVLLEKKLQKEMAYTYIGAVFDRMYAKRTFSTEYIYGEGELLFDCYTSNTAVQERYGFIYNVLSVNQILIENFLQEDKKSGAV